VDPEDSDLCPVSVPILVFKYAVVVVVVVINSNLTNMRFLIYARTGYARKGRI